MEPGQGWPPGENPGSAAKLVASRAEHVPREPETRGEMHPLTRQHVRTAVEDRVHAGVVRGVPIEVQEVGAHA